MKKILIALWISSFDVSFAASTTISPAEKAKIVSTLNAARATPRVPSADMKRVKWDSFLESVMDAHRSQLMRPDWFLDANNLPSSYSYLFHDTCKSENMSVAGIFSFRVKQKACFNYNNCQANSPRGGYTSCYNTAVDPNRNCNWWWQYYPVMLNSNLETIACVRLGYPGPNAPHGQDNSFVCYGRWSNEGMNIPDGFPYQSGEACSACSSAYPTCIQNLCSPLSEN